METQQALSKAKQTGTPIGRNGVDQKDGILLLRSFLPSLTPCVIFGDSGGVVVKNVRFPKLMTSEDNTQLYMSVCVNFIFKVPLFPTLSGK